MSDDPINNEVSVSGELTPTGVKAAAKSRCVSAIDRFLGNLIDYFNPRIEISIEEQRANTRARIAAIDAFGKEVVKRIGANPDYIDRYIQNELLSSTQKIENKTFVLSAALRDLRDNPPNENENNSGPNEINPNIVDRIKRYSEDSSTDELREKWGRVLASEIKNPGMLSVKSLRIIDEINQRTALLFEGACQYRIGGIIPAFLFPDINYLDKRKLVTSELILDPGDFGQLAKMTKVSTHDGSEIWQVRFGNYSIAFGVEEKWKASLSGADKCPMVFHEDDPAIRIYIISDEALPIAKIINADQERNLELLADKLSESMVGIRFFGYRINASGQFARITEKFREKSVSGAVVDAK